MSKNTKEQIGKGIGALLGNIKEEVSSFKDKNTLSSNILGSITRIPIDKIKINPKQPRRDFDQQALEELSASIKTYDLIQPITVFRLNTNTFQLISGERRLRASKMAGLKDIPAYIKSDGEENILELALLENIQRENLNAIEVALSFRQLMEECAITQEELADKVKKDRSTVANFLRLLKLPPGIQADVRNGTLSMGHARALLGVEHIDQQLMIFNEIKQLDLSVRATEQLIKSLRSGKKKGNTALKKGLPPEYKKIEDRLASHLSTKVVMNRKHNGKGTLLIEFYNDDDLERILDLMNL